MIDLFSVLPTDTLFSDSPDVGEPTCVCSRCNQPIGEDEVPIRAFLPDGTGEYRYHADCIPGLL